MQKITKDPMFRFFSDPKDVAPSMANGFTINHIAAVIFPTLSGLLWILNYQIPFIACTIMSCVSLFFVQFIKYNKDINI